jgi:hypothetical protein
MSQPFDIESYFAGQSATLLSISKRRGPLVTPLAPQSGDQPIEMDCVLREVSYKDMEYVPVCEVPFLEPGETIFHGAFNTQVESHGPSGSHRRTICLPVGGLKRRKAPGQTPRR